MRLITFVIEQNGLHGCTFNTSFMLFTRFHIIAVPSRARFTFSNSIVKSSHDCIANVKCSSGRTDINRLYKMSDTSAVPNENFLLHNRAVESIVAFHILFELSIRTYKLKVKAYQAKNCKFQSKMFSYKSGCECYMKSLDAYIYFLAYLNFEKVFPQQNKLS